MQEPKWVKKEEDGYVLIENKDGQILGIAKDSRVQILTRDGYAFKDFQGTGELLPYEDWRLSYEERAEDLAERISIEDIAGLMLYSAHQLIPAKGPLAAAFGGTYDGKSYEESGVKPWELTDQQKEFITKDRVRHVLIMGLESTEAAVRWNNKIQALAENSGYGIPVNNSSDPRHGAGSMAEYMGVTGEPISKWANGIGLSASFDPELVKCFGEMGSAEYRALGITTALSPQIDLATEPRWMRFVDTFGEHTQMTIDMTKAYCDGFQTTDGTRDGWGQDSVNTMVKHFPGGGMGEAGRDAHYAYGKYAVYPGENFEEHLKPFTEGAFSLDGKTGKASAVMPYYTISYDIDKTYGENVGNSYNKYLIQDLLRENLGYEGVVCTDWGITHDLGKTEEEFAGKCWGVEHLTESERHLKALEAGVDQFGGNNDVAPVMEAYEMACEKYGKEAADARFRRSAYRLLLNIFRTGLFENPYLNLEKSEAVVGCEKFVKAGYESQLKSVTMLKNRDQVLPLKEGIRVYVPARQIRSYLNFMSMPTGDQEVVPAGKHAAGKYFTVVDTPEEADAALCFMESPISVGYDPEDKKAGGNGYVPVTLQYRPYQAVSAREESIAGGDPLEESKNRSYKEKWNTAANEADLDNIIHMRKLMGDKPVIAVVSLKNPMVMAEFEPYTDAVLVEYGVNPEAVIEVLAGKFEPRGLLPVQIPKDMETVEGQKEDVAFDMECYTDSEGHTYDFGYGLNFTGVIADERTGRYAK
ncbi:MAG: glycoside hydrolase family 3 C-terminal domain-containing protein [Clostridiales bacterium]|nr:glycoside hydrolase family 3 C-terminal domain-containing protein [Clostridiales bacterium]